LSADRETAVGRGTNWIAVETSGDRASAAVALPGGTVIEELVTGTRQHASELVPAIDRMLSRSGVKITQLRGIVVSEGPGSFTGLRIGATVAKALAHVHAWPLRRASALSVIARGAWRAKGSGHQRVLAVTDALRGEVYAALYHIHPTALQAVMEPAVLAPGELAHWPAADLVASSLDLPPLVGGLRVGGDASLPTAATLLDLLEVEGGTAPVHDLETWEPEYGRPAEAQARWEAQHGRRLPHSSGTTR
jgi:tRNA threonylcarbamoyladenosine biosynthesis protein TsaB